MKKAELEAEVARLDQLVTLAGTLLTLTIDRLGGSLEVSHAEYVEAGEKYDVQITGTETGFLLGLTNQGEHE